VVLERGQRRKGQCDSGWIHTKWLIVTKGEDDLLSAMARGQNNSQEASQ
jgi:hypothetical protein